MKKVIAACIDKILEFDNQEEAANYIEGLRNKKANFKILYREQIGNKHRIRVQEAYNKCPMIEN